MRASRITVDIVAWLKELGLEQYQRAFLDNAIDADVLPTLTVDDLKDIGVTVVGHRRKLLNAIATLREPESRAGTASNAPLALIPDRLVEAERRQLTVLFCDLVGSTMLSQRPGDQDGPLRTPSASLPDTTSCDAPTLCFHGIGNGAPTAVSTAATSNPHRRGRERTLTVVDRSEMLAGAPGRS
jgi:hypothetical protein